MESLPNGYGKSFRLLSKADFQNLRTKSFKIVTKSFVIYYKYNSFADKRSRIGFSLSRKMGKAVSRNLTKRVFREWFRKSDLKYYSLDLLIIARPKSLKSLKTDGLKTVINDCYNILENKITSTAVG